MLIERTEHSVCARDLHDASTSLHDQALRPRKILEIAHHVISRREIFLAVVRKAHARVLGHQRVPVHAQIELGILRTGVALVDGYEATMPWEHAEERARPIASFYGEEVTSVAGKQGRELQSRGTGTDHQIFHDVSACAPPMAHLRYEGSGVAAASA